ncbi:cupredoxin domain-containing protein [Corynebacterium sp. Marseille-P3884]|uniref:cupredoxin domain-containing protein n=1 Tax=Corynebacterium sp. Marseille-P3884 TaxID=2495409 RepID=UPI001B340F68|nr:cupredoxin domain-containing protein [Corynebacterium sp. Marseille-P3884]MBP3948768.1 cupredoxin domain-containing protein [Corynebacterium sp. Marseille-P3884]
MTSPRTASTRRSNIAAWAVVALLVIASVAGALVSHARAGDARDLSGPVIQEVTIEGMRFSPARVEVDASTPVVLKITNNDDRNHDLKIGSHYSGIIAPGTTVVRDFGTYSTNTQGWCTMASHKSRGMVYDVVMAD